MGGDWDRQIGETADPDAYVGLAVRFNGRESPFFLSSFPSRPVFLLRVFIHPQTLTLVLSCILRLPNHPLSHASLFLRASPPSPS